MKNVRIVDKGEHPKYIDWDLYTYFNDITTFKLYERDWSDLEVEELVRYFENEEEFEQRKIERQQGEGVS
ncbi:hypothetical protein [Niallia sp. Krafla_26]|uniref:hypothetical protein n=1 Tax=Niallia sp. Krafla_26 TaxID=3064703 RepID=UPI003D17C5EB